MPIKMAEENQVTAKDPKKVKAGKRLAEYNHRKREELKVQKSEVLTGAVLAVGVIGSLGYYVYQAKKGEVNAVTTLYLISNPLRLRSLKWSKFLLYYKMDKKSIVNDLYHASFISALQLVTQCWVRRY